MIANTLYFSKKTAGITKRIEGGDRINNYKYIDIQSNKFFFLKCYLVQCIGAMTLDEYRKYIEKDSALKRRFQLVEVPEPSIDETILILQGLCKKYENHHKIQYTEEALIASANLSKQYIRFVFLNLIFQVNSL